MNLLCRNCTEALLRYTLASLRHQRSQLATSLADSTAPQTAATVLAAKSAANRHIA